MLTKIYGWELVLGALPYPLFWIGEIADTACVEKIVGFWQRSAVQMRAKFFAGELSY